ncbi:serine/threonine-protein kinase [uncultured Methylibium sp.]|uniref:serine/threonine-protein kinase n=1 Tax=uncultured Methylibium sp. TaxID=381093 RepID=UPI0025EF9508|nr:serine/threonine-protein kinase [uncultured Methylibium sp.]
MNARADLLESAPPGQEHPARLGKYVLTGVLGEGAMGTVYKGVDPVIHRAVAVKAIRRHLFDVQSGSISAAQRFRNEAQAAGRLSHPGIVSVYEYGEEAGTAYIAMEYAQGCSLGQYLALPLRLPEADVLSLMVQLLEALHYAHEQGVWHRDVKPANLIITSEGRLKVTDFGIARIESNALTQLQHTLLLIGSPGYIAPERYTGEAPDQRVDLFSCGVLLYQMLTGVPPFAGTDSEVMYQVLQHEPTAPSKVEGTLPTEACYDDVVARALAKRPVDRFASALEFRDALLSLASRPVNRRLSTALIRGIEAVTDARATTPVGPRLPMQSQPQPRVDSLPAAVPKPPQATGPAWEATQLKAIEILLAEHLGPLARVLVQRQAAVTPAGDVAALTETLAAAALAADDRKLFLAAAARLRPGAVVAAPPPLRAAPPTLVLEVAGAQALQPATLEAAQALLAAHIGPIARLMVKNALSVAGDRDNFFKVLADLAADCIDRQRLLDELARLPR